MKKTITAAEFVNTNFFHYIIKDIIKRGKGIDTSHHGAYDIEDIRSSITLGILEYFEEKGGEIDITGEGYIADAEDYKGLCRSAYQRVRELHSLDFSVTTPYDHGHLTSGSKEKIAAAYHASLEPWDIWAQIEGGEKMDNPSCNRLEEHISNVVYVAEDVTNYGNDSATNVVLSETFNVSDKNDSELMMKIIEFVDSLSEKEKEAVKLWADGMTQSEACEATGFTQEHIKYLLKKLKKIVK